MTADEISLPLMFYTPFLIASMFIIVIYVKKVKLFVYFLAFFTNKCNWTFHVFNDMMMQGLKYHILFVFLRHESLIFAL